jgi:hypothetical protein
MDIFIKGKALKFEFSSVWGPLYTYEEVCGPSMPFNPKKTICMHVMWWCILVRANENCTVTLEEFIQALNDVKLVAQLSEYYAKRMEVLTTADEQKAESEDSKKKD